MPQIKLRLGFEELRSIDSATFAGAYLDIGTPFENPLRAFKITNNSTVDVIVSYDGGTTDHEIVPAGSFFLFDISSNRVCDAEFVIAAKTQVSVKGSAGVGLVYLSSYYAR